VPTHPKYLSDVYTGIVIEDHIRFIKGVGVDEDSCFYFLRTLCRDIFLKEMSFKLNLKVDAKSFVDIHSTHHIIIVLLEKYVSPNLSKPSGFQSNPVKTICALS